jgi:hypothetical protein
MKHPRYSICVAMLALALGLSGCGDDDPTGGDETSITMRTKFNLNVDGQPILLNQLAYTNSSGTTYSISGIRFVISDVVLHGQGGTAIKVADLHYFDSSEISTQTFEYTGLPHEEWTSVSFTFGLDETDNVRDKYVSRTQFHLDMQWPQILGANLGYHYMQLEGEYSTGGGTAAYTTHTGPRQLDGTNPDFPGIIDATPYHFHFAVDLPFTPTHIHNEGRGDLTINFNLNDWYKDSDAGDGLDSEYDFADYPTQLIMGNLDAQGKLHANGRYCFSATLEAIGGHHDY